MQSGRHEWACFAAHQAVEKALKGLNLALGQQVWTPDPPADLEDRLRMLDGFYIPTRYPDSYPEGTPGEHFGRLQSEQALLHERRDGRSTRRARTLTCLPSACSAPMAAVTLEWKAISILS